MQDMLQQRLDYAGLGQETGERLAPVSESARRHLDQALQQFSAQLTAMPSAVRFLHGRERIEGDGGGPLAHWQALIAGHIGPDFAEAAMRTGHRLARIGVDPRWQAGSHAIIVQALVRGMILDGIAGMMASRRGPLGLLGLPDKPAVNDAGDRLARGVATLVGAAIVDLDLVFSGYHERLRQDGLAQQAAQQARLRETVQAAGLLLSEAAEGRRDASAPVHTDPELAPLQAGAAVLADRVMALLDDLEVAGQAAQALAQKVIAGGRDLLAGQAERDGQVHRLAALLAHQETNPSGTPAGADDLLRRGRAALRRCNRQRRDLVASAQAVDGEQDSGGVVEQVDALGLAANLVAARLAQGGSDAGEAAGFDADLRDLARGLARVSAQLRAEADRRDHAKRDADQAAARRLAGLDLTIGDLTALCEGLAGLERSSADRAAALAEAGELARAMAAAEGQGLSVLEQLAEALDGARALVALAHDMAAAPVEDEAGATCPAPDQAALAAHWHVA